MKITVTLDEDVLLETFADNKVEVYVRALATTFCALDGQAQAQFFEHVADIIGRDWLRNLVQEIDLTMDDQVDDPVPQ